MAEQDRDWVSHIRDTWDRDFVPVAADFVPWCHLADDPSRLRLALVSTGGLYLRQGFQQPFSTAPPEGDRSFRELPGNVELADLAIAHPGYDPGWAAGDRNVVFPLERLRQLAPRGLIGELAPLHYSFMGQCSRPLGLLLEGACAVTQRLRQAQVGAVLLVTVSALDHQTAGLLARGFEAAGVPTLVLGVLPDWLRRIRPPRAVWVDHPVGAPLGQPGNAGKHQEVLKAALAALADMTDPGSLWELPFRWHPK